MLPQWNTHSGGWGRLFDTESSVGFVHSSSVSTLAETSPPSLSVVASNSSSILRLRGFVPTNSGSEDPLDRRLAVRFHCDDLEIVISFGLNMQSSRSPLSTVVM